jgi:hypothetical protein
MGKIFTIKSTKDKLLSVDFLLEILAYVKEYLNNGRHWITLNIDNNELQSSQFTKNIYELFPQYLHNI